MRSSSGVCELLQTVLFVSRQTKPKTQGSMAFGVNNAVHLLSRSRPFHSLVPFFNPRPKGSTPTG